ncbi:MAG: hypothetical protein ACKO6K_09340, partial [Chitinophagaceae bacterium]
GLSKVMYGIAGELGQSLANNAAVPNWFWEGDAVYQETWASEQGRGRLPYFFNGYRSLWGAGKTYSWSKLRNGSLRDYVPDHYQLGYLLTAYGRQQWGDGFWNAVTRQAVSFRKLFYPFQAAVQHETGLAYPKFYHQALSFYEKRQKGITDTFARLANQQKHFMGDEEFPQFVDDDHLLLVKSSYRAIPGFYLRDLVTGTDRLIRVKDLSLDNYFSYRNGQIVYAALAFDPRWGWRDYSEIRLLDVHTGKQRTLTRRTKLFSPDISEEGKWIVAVAQEPSGESFIQWMDADSGHIVRSWKGEEGTVYSHPKFFGTAGLITCVRNRQGQMALLYLDRDGRYTDTLVPFSYNVIGYPQVKGDSLAITLTHGEQDALFLFRDKHWFRFRPAKENRITGSYQLCTGRKRVAWVAFTAVGKRVFTEENTSLLWQSQALQEIILPLAHFGVQGPAAEYALEASAGSSPAAFQRYSTADRIIRIHSWLPNLSETEFSYTLLSQNVLNTLQSELAFTYNTNEGSRKVSAAGTFGGWYPWLRAGGGYTWHRNFLYRNQRVDYDEVEGRAGWVIPFNLSGGKTYAGLRWGNDYVYARSFYAGNYKDSFDRRGYAYWSQHLQFFRQSQQARQHIFPRFAQRIRIQYDRAISRLQAHQWLIQGNWYFPGLAVNHNLVITTAWQKRDTFNQLRFSNTFPFSRGYPVTNIQQMLKWGINYHLPLAYPDWGMAQLVYFLRIRTNVFYDQTHTVDPIANRRKQGQLFRTAGVELHFDTKWWNQVPVSFGLRYARLLDAARQNSGPNQWEFILPVNLINR